MKAVKKVRFTLVFVSIMVISLMVSGISSAKVDFRDCVGMWLFDEDKGDVAKDSSSKGNDGKVVGKAKRVDGRFGSALNFDGKADFVDVKLDVLNLSKDQSFSVLFKTKLDKNIHSQVLNAPHAEKNRLWLWIMRNGHGARGKLGFGFRASDIGYEVFTGKPLNDGNWHHAVAVFDHAAKKGLLYIDGKLDIQKTIEKVKFTASQKRLCIASGCGGKNSFWLGQIDDVGVFNVALKEGDVKSIMNEGLRKALGVGGATAVSPTGKLATIWASTKAQ